MAIRYLVPDGTHLPVTGEDGKPDHYLMGAAWAALHGGYRGNKYEGADKDKAIAALKALYKSEGMDTPGDGGAKQSYRAQMPCRVLQSLDAEGALWDVEITKVGPCDGTPALDWPAEVLERDKQVFQGMASYINHLTDRDLREGRGHSIDDLLGHIENPRMGDGALIGTLHLLNPAVWGPKFRAYQKLPPGIAGMSTDVRFLPAKERGVGGRQKVAEIIRSVSNSLDLVTPPGGGGRILRAVQAEGNEEWEEVKAVAELDPTARTSRGGLTMKEKIQRILQAIKRLDPARGAKVETEVASLDEEKQFEHVTQALGEIEPQRVQQKKCTECDAELTPNRSSAISAGQNRRLPTAMGTRGSRRGNNRRSAPKIARRSPAPAISRGSFA